MGIRGELFSTRIKSANERRTYFFNVKENRGGDLFLTVVESKEREGGTEFDRHQVVIFEDDLSAFEQGLKEALDAVRARRERPRRVREPKKKTYRVRIAASEVKSPTTTSTAADGPAADDNGGDEGADQ